MDFQCPEDDQLLAVVVVAAAVAVVVVVVITIVIVHLKRSKDLKINKLHLFTFIQ